MRAFDVAVYLLLSVLLLLCLMQEGKNYVCDTYTCRTFQYQAAHHQGRDLLIALINDMSSHTVWYRSYIVAFTITVIAFWWMYSINGVPTVDTIPLVYRFTIVLLLSFAAVYFSCSFYQYHFVRPLGAYIIANLPPEEERDALANPSDRERSDPSVIEAMRRS